MTPEHFQAVEALFNHALEASGEERERLLGGAPAEVASEVREMLAVHPHAREFLDVPAPELEVLAPEFVGRQIGAYEIKEKIGVGGSGTVFRADRVDDFRQRVAIKIIRSGLTSEEIVRRFKTERRVLANLQNEHIARLIDAGVTSEGLPYLVMEFVDGEPIDEYCRRARLSVEDRLKLFCDVCAGVHAAHRNLVVHRDLKPSNILVTSDGVVKLVDFGIAKILEPDAERTVTEQRMLTPRYASPEQITGRAVTTASDIYSLGVILYELLSGE
ncbi:MAG: serine/threonine protein kinase, partial [Phycisphaerales bacterium]|nr:serine/threonine protein kinase [Phycisphaerales bacterium]